MIGPVYVAPLLVAGFVNAPPVTADIVLTGFLSGSTDALVMGPTGFPDPADYPGFLTWGEPIDLDRDAKLRVWPQQRHRLHDPAVWSISKLHQGAAESAACRRQSYQPESG